MSLPLNPQRILVICIRRIGDVLLSTALIHSLKRQWPQAEIDVLVNAGASIALEGNPEIRRLIVQPEKPSILDFLKLAARIFRAYDLSVCTLYNDRPHLYSFLASRLRAGVLPPKGHVGYGWKKFLTTYPASYELGASHAIQQYLAVVRSMGIPAIARVVPPRPTRNDPHSHQPSNYVVLHPSPMYRYKAWTVQGWRELTQYLLDRGYTVYFTGGNSTFEREEIDRIMPTTDKRAVNLAGRLRFCELTPLIEGARLFVGPDTSVTHLAAATGTPTIAVFGPSPTTAWGPWPQQESPIKPSPWQLTAPIQHQGNVWIVQGIKPCVPCMKQGCQNTLDSRSDCLDELPASRVIEVLEPLLEIQPI